MSSESKPFDGYDSEDLSLSTPMGSSIVLLSLYPIIRYQLNYCMDSLTLSYYTILPYLSFVQLQPFYH